MKIRKDLIVVALATFCLTATLFMIIPTRSEYDPWADLKEDGTIDIYDAILLSNAFGTSGDPTRNVNVTNLPNYDLQQGTSANISSIGPPTFSVSVVCGGYSRLSLLCLPTNASIGNNNAITVILYAITWFSAPVTGQYYPLSSESLNADAFNFTIYNGGIPWYAGPTFLTETKAPYCDLTFRAIPVGVNLPANWWVTFDYSVYLRNE